MNQLFAALQDYLSQLGMPVWMDGNVPSGTQAPYAVWQLETGAFGEASQLTVTCWYRLDHAGCVSALHCLRSLFPAQGAMLRYPGGLTAGYPIAYTLVHDAQDKALEGGRLRAELRVYERPAGEEDAV